MIATTALPQDPRRQGTPTWGSLPRELLVSLAAHRVLTTQQIAALHTPGQAHSTSSKALARLLDAGMVERTKQVPRLIGIPPRARARIPGSPTTAGARLERGGRRWWLTPAGLDMAARLTRTPVDPVRLVVTDDVAVGLHQATLVTNEVGVVLTEWCRELATPARPITSRFGPWSWRTGHPLPPDPSWPEMLADAVILDDDRVVGMLEVDLGEPVEAMTTRLIDLAAWAEQSSWDGRLLLVCAGGSAHGSAQGRCDRLLDALADTEEFLRVAHTLQLRVVTLDALAEHGPAAATPVAEGTGAVPLFEEVLPQP